jgi:hypothetical protein
MALYDSWIKEHSISRAAVRDLMDCDQRSIDLFRTADDAPILSIYSSAMYGLMIIGTLALFSSFFIFNFLRLVFFAC